MFPFVDPLPIGGVTFDNPDRSKLRLKIDIAPFLDIEELYPSVREDWVLTFLPKVRVVGSTVKTE